MTKPPKEQPDLSEYEEEKIPLEDVLRQILKAKPAVKPLGDPAPPKPSKD